MNVKNIDKNNASFSESEIYLGQLDPLMIDWLVGQVRKLNNDHNTD